MSVYQRGGVWWMEFCTDGHRVRKSTQLTNRREAEAFERAFRTNLAKGEVGIEKKKRAPTLKVFAQTFADFISIRHAEKPETVTFYANKLKRVLSHEELRETRLDRIDEPMVERYIQWRRRKVSATTVNLELATLRRLLHVAKDQKILKVVPKIKLLTGARQRDFVLSHEQERAYLEAAPEPLKTVALVLLDTGLRVGECLHLLKEDVHVRPAGNARFGWIHVRDGKSRNAKRNVPMTSRVSLALAPRLEESPSPWIFPGDSPERPILVSSLGHLHIRVCRPGSGKARRYLFPKDFVLHSCRHTLLTRLGEAGADAFTIMKLAGHSSVTISQRYVHPTPDTVERAFERLEALNRAALANPSNLQKVPTNSPTSIGAIAVSC